MNSRSTKMERSIMIFRTTRSYVSIVLKEKLISNANNLVEWKFIKFVRENYS